MNKDKAIRLFVAACFMYLVIVFSAVVFRIGLALLAGIATVGFVSGIFVGLKNVVRVLIEAHQKLL